MSGKASPRMDDTMSDGATVVGPGSVALDHGYNNNHLRPVASGSKQHSYSGPPKGLPVPVETAEQLPFVDETAYLDVKR